jgi:hypothetical protein
VGVFSPHGRLVASGLASLAVSACGFSSLDGLMGSDFADAGGDVADVAQVETSDGAARVDVAVQAAIPDASVDSATADVGAMSEGAAAEAGAVATFPEAGRGCDGGCAGGYCSGSECVFPSCGARLLAYPKGPSGVYMIDPDGVGGTAAFRAFCEMVLDGGGWTLAMKVDGTRTTFVHDSPLWENADVFQPDSADFDRAEAKLATFATMPFGNVRVGMAQNGATRWLVLPLRAQSLVALMSSGQHATSVGRFAWERLTFQGSLQLNCNREGINVETTQASVRIGIVANNQDDCSTCNSWIGLGAEGQTTGDLACGNVAQSNTDNGARDDALFGYVMVR